MIKLVPQCLAAQSVAQRPLEVCASSSTGDACVLAGVLGASRTGICASVGPANFSVIACIVSAGGDDATSGGAADPSCHSGLLHSRTRACCPLTCAAGCVDDSSARVPEECSVELILRLGHLCSKAGPPCVIGAVRGGPALGSVAGGSADPSSQLRFAERWAPTPAPARPAALDSDGGPQFSASDFGLVGVGVALGVSCLCLCCCCFAFLCRLSQVAEDIAISERSLQEPPTNASSTPAARRRSSKVRNTTLLKAERRVSESTECSSELESEPDAEPDEDQALRLVAGAEHDALCASGVGFATMHKEKTADAPEAMRPCKKLGIRKGRVSKACAVASACTLEVEPMVLGLHALTAVSPPEALSFDVGQKKEGEDEEAAETDAIDVRMHVGVDCIHGNMRHVSARMALPQAAEPPVPGPTPRAVATESAEGPTSSALASVLGAVARLETNHLQRVTPRDGLFREAIPCDASWHRKWDAMEEDMFDACDEAGAVAPRLQLPRGS